MGLVTCTELAPACEIRHLLPIEACAREFSGENRG